MLDILDQLDVNYLALAGGTTCCGQKYLGSGDSRKASESVDNLASALASFKPKKVLFWCGSCFRIFKHDAPGFTNLPFEVQHYSQYIVDNLSKFKFPSPLNKTITVHDSCGLGRKGGDYTSMRQLLGAIPGVKLVEMPHNREEALCCGGATHRHFPEIAERMRKLRMDEADGTGADSMVVSCQGCNRFFYRDEKDHHFEVNSYVTIFAEALGFTYEDKVKKYMALDRLDDVLEDAKEYIEASPLTREQTKKLVSGFFNKT
jgi:Fe-S oxidoreductase